MKRIGIILVSLALVTICVFLLPTQAQAATEQAEGDFVYTVTDGNATITRVLRHFTGELMIPSTLGGYPVTVIGDQAFIAQTDLDSVIIPKGVTTIGDSAFSACNKLTSITIPNSVTSIGNHAFSSCNSLAGITLPNSLITIGNSAFWRAGLSSIVIPDSVTTIGNDVFTSCEYLTSVTIGKNVKSIGAYAFSRCHRLKGIVIPDSVTSIGENAFYNCTGLTYATIGDGVTDLGNFAFYSCYSITNLEIGNGLTSIPECAFTYCESLTSVTIPEGVTSIEVSAFAHCKNLTTVIIPDSVVEIAPFAFDGCNHLQYSNYDNGRYLGNADNPFLVLMYTGSADITSCVIHKDTKVIGSEAFRFHNNLVSVTIPESVIAINGSAFWECFGLTKVYHKGSQADWNKIVIGTENNSLNDATIIHNYNGCDHVWDANVITQEASCGVVGTKTYTCTACGESLTRETEKPAGHRYTDGVCTVCGEAEPGNNEDVGFFEAIVNAIMAAFAAFLAIFGIKV